MTSNHTQSQFSDSVAELISRRGAFCPEALALRDVERELTFGELDAKSNQLAHFLIQSGVRTGDVVAVILPRSGSFVVAALAAMKAGAAYLPIDPEYPQDRVDYIIRNSQALIVLTDREHMDRVPASVPSQVIDSALDAFSCFPDHAPEIHVSEEDLAYVIYTSGSTGQPKGVELTHSGLMNLVQWHNRAFSLTPADRSSQVAAIGFDAAVWEIWPPLCAGASLSIPDGATKADPQRLRDWFVEEKITVAFAPTPIAELLITLSWPADTALRTLLTGADALKRFPAAGLPFDLINNYGPTESTVVATSGFVPTAHETTELPSIGKAIDGIQIYILDEKLQPVAPGEDGEICIGGAGLARGYRNNPDLTAQQFVTYAAENVPVRVYRTGDIGRLSEQGEIEFRGRADNQVKIRGHRIELQEIALMLNQHPGVRACEVLAVENEGGEKELVAYVVSEGDIPGASCTAHLAKSLPKYMLPSAFIRLSEFPMTSNGKLDKAALPPLRRATTSPAETTEPRSLVEERMQKLVAQLLGLESVDVHENFFLLGGHSLFGAQLISRVRNNFGIELPLRRVFEQPTVELLSRQIEMALAAQIQSQGKFSLGAIA